MTPAVQFQWIPFAIKSKRSIEAKKGSPHNTILVSLLRYDFS